MKRLAINYHFVRDIVAKGELKVSHVPSYHPLVDLLTKLFSRPRHEFLITKIGVVDSSSILQGHISDKCKQDLIQN